MSAIELAQLICDVTSSLAEQTKSAWLQASSSYAKFDASQSFEDFEEQSAFALKYFRSVALFQLKIQQAKLLTTAIEQNNGVLESLNCFLNQPPVCSA
jgi:hypothetical protein